MLATLERPRILDALAAPARPWRDPAILDRCGSTNAELLEDARPWRVVVADEQVSGRGRLDRSWSTPAGVALAISISLPLPDRIERLAWFSPMTAMAVVRALRQVTGVGAMWKWPNDVLLAAAEVPGSSPRAVTEDGSIWGKGCGILGQVSPERTLVMGVGINLAQRLDQLPVPTATSVAACGAELSEHVREDLLVDFLDQVAELHTQVVAGGEGLEKVVAEYRAGCQTLGRRVRVSLPDGTVQEGLAESVDAGAQLVVRTEDDVLHTHAAGDVVHVRGRGGYA